MVSHGRKIPRKKVRKIIVTGPFFTTSTLRDTTCLAHSQIYQIEFIEFRDLDFLDLWVLTKWEESERPDHLRRLERWLISWKRVVSMNAEQLS